MAKHDDTQSHPEAGDEGIARRKALQKIVTTAAYAAPIATVLLANAREAKAGVALSMTPTPT